MECKFSMRQTSHTTEVNVEIIPSHKSLDLAKTTAPKPENSLLIETPNKSDSVMTKPNSVPRPATPAHMTETAKQL
ncbi:hypothetical protein Lal_00000775 [Lupinus albus]|nr:hypothetical protein Lal_00000775 [Lupinus albus]